MTVSTEELMAITADTTVDARGTSCPGPILAAKKAIGGVPVGGVMEVLLLGDVRAHASRCAQMLPHGTRFCHGSWFLTDLTTQSAVGDLAPPHPAAPIVPVRWGGPAGELG